jgi:hypothetical protein
MLLVALGVLRLITIVVFANGMGALAATAASLPFASQSDAAWVEDLFSFALTIGITSLVTAVASFRLMPSWAALRRRETPGEPAAPAVETLLLAGLAIIAALQVPALVNWWNADRMLLREVIGSGWDPLGLELIPAVMLFSLPTLATALLAAFLATSVAAALAPRRATKQVLIAGVILQAGVVVVEYLALGGVQDLGRTIVQAMDTAPSDASAQAIDWFGRHDRVARLLTWRVAAVFAGYLMTLFVVAYSSRDAGPGGVATDSTAPVAPPPVPVPAAVPPSISQASGAFDASHYVLRLRHTFIGMIAGRRFIAYDIQTIPPRSRTQLSFSWATGLMRREPSGPDLLLVQSAERHGLFARAYVVTEPASGSVLGKLVPHGSDWDIVDAQGRAVASVVETHAAFDRATYVVTAGNHEVCRLTWIGGMTIAGEVEIEFLRAADRGIDRALPMALAPVLEDRARRARRH